MDTTTYYCASGQHVDCGGWVSKSEGLPCVCPCHRHLGKAESWVVKKRFEFPSELAPHINWESFAPLMDIWGRLDMRKDFETGAVVIKVLAPEQTEDAKPTAAPNRCTCAQCLVIREKEQQRIKREGEN